MLTLLVAAVLLVWAGMLLEKARQRPERVRQFGWMSTEGDASEWHAPDDLRP